MRFFIRYGAMIVDEFEAASPLEALETPEAARALRERGRVTIEELGGETVARAVAYRERSSIRWGWDVAPSALPPERDEELRATG